MIEDCVLYSLVVWLHPQHSVPVKYRQVSRPLYRTGHWTSWSMQCGFLVHSGVCPPPRKQPFAAAQLCVRQAHERCLCCGNEVEFTTEKTATVPNSTRLLPHHIYKTPNRLAPAVLHICFSLLSAPCSFFSLSSAHLAVSVTCNSPISCTIYSVLWSPAEE